MIKACNCTCMYSKAKYTYITLFSDVHAHKTVFIRFSTDRYMLSFKCHVYHYRKNVAFVWKTKERT